MKRLKYVARDKEISSENFQRLYDNAFAQMQCMMNIAYLTALKKGDILKIKLSDIQDNELQIDVEKTKKKMSFNLEGDLATVIERAKSLNNGKGKSHYLFSTKTGKPISKDNFDSMWTFSRKKVGLMEVHLHDIRAKAATDADTQGLNAQKFLGHKSRMSTERYIKQRKYDKVIPLKRDQTGENIRQTP